MAKPSTSTTPDKRRPQGNQTRRSSLPEPAIPRARVEALLYGYRYISVAVALSAGAALVSAGISVWLVAKDHVVERYFATDPSGRITKLVPMDQPYLTHQAITQFAERAITGLLTFDGVNYKQQFAASRPYLTDSAIDGVQRELVRTGLIAEVQQERAIVTTLAEGTPIIRAEGIDRRRNIYAWKVQVPIRMTVQTSHKTADQRYNALITVERRRLTSTGSGVLVTGVVLAAK